MKRHKLWGGVGAIWVIALISLAIYEAELSKQLRASHDRLRWSFDVLANDRASADMKAADEAAKAQDDRFMDEKIDLWIDRELHRYRI
jgi:hypothetical protein